MRKKGRINGGKTGKGKGGRGKGRVRDGKKVEGEKNEEGLGWGKEVMVKDEMKGEELGFGERVKGGGRKGNGYE